MNASILTTTEEIEVNVQGSDYAYNGWLVGIAIKRSGQVRYIVEDVNGRLFIHNARQLGVQEGWMPS